MKRALKNLLNGILNIIKLNKENVLISKDDIKIAVIGLGYVGLPLAVEFGKKYSVTGFDVNVQRIKELKNGKDITLEVDDNELKNSKNLTFTSDIHQIKPCNIYIVTVPTPIDENKSPDLQFLESASEMIGKVLKDKNIVIYESTVYPGCTEEICVPILEKNSKLNYISKDDDQNLLPGFFVGYSPERINPGDKVNTLPTIKKITSGSNEAVASEIDDIYQEIIKAGTWRASSIKVAEAAKVIENCQRDLNIAFVNELSLIFEKLEIDTLDVLEAAGSKWNFLPFRPGMVGGHCIGVDPYYLTHKSEEVGYHPEVILAGRRINDSMASYAANIFIKKMSQNKIQIHRARVGLLGVTFKENCPDIRNSKISDLISELINWGIEILAYDPWADYESVKNEMGIELVSLDDLVKLDSLIVAVGHKENRELKPEDLRGMCREDIIPVCADLKSLYSRNALISKGFTTFRL